MKGLIVSLPFDISPDSIPLALPTLLAQFEKAKLDVRGIDFNAELYNEILTSKYLKDCYKNIEKQYLEFSKSSSFENFSNTQKIYSQIVKNKAKIDKLIKNIPAIRKEFKNKDLNIDSRIPHQMMDVLKVAFAPYSEYTPWKSFLHSYNYQSIKDFACSKENNIFYNFLLKYGKRYNFKKYDFVGISLPLENSLYYAFTLGKYIKENAPNTKVVFGGAIITRLWDDFLKYPEIFDTYCDNLLVGDGDNSLIQYANYIKKKISPEKVAGLVYRNDNSQLIFNETENVDINEIVLPSYKRLDMSKYPKQILLNIQFSRGCPWGQCAFCTFSYPYRKKYSILSPEKAVDMVEELVKKYNVRNFYVVDETLQFKFFIGFAEELVKRNIKISYDCRLRFSESYTLETFKLLAKSGLRSIFWGYEAESERVLKLMNKGLNPEIRYSILKNAKDAGIINKLGFIFGFPSETEDEIMQTISFIKNNYKKIFDMFGISIFSLEKNSHIIKSPENFAISQIKRKSDLGISHSYYDATISSERVYELINYCTKLVGEQQNVEQGRCL